MSYLCTDIDVKEILELLDALNPRVEDIWDADFQLPMKRCFTRQERNEVKQMYFNAFNRRIVEMKHLVSEGRDTEALVLFNNKIHPMIHKSWREQICELWKARVPDKSMRAIVFAMRHMRDTGLSPDLIRYIFDMM